MPPRKKNRTSPKQKSTPMEVENDEEENVTPEAAQVSVASTGFHAGDEQEAIYLRTSRQGSVTERFLNIGSPKSTKSEDLYEHVLAVFKDCNVDKDKLVGMGSDGASNMTGSRSGLSTLLRQRVNPEMVNVHCLCHRLELAFRDTLKKSKLYDKLMTLLIGLHYFYKKSYKNKSALLIAIQAVGKGILPPKVTGTRWLPHLCRGIGALLKTYRAFEAQLSTASHENAKAEGLLKLMTDHNVIAFAIFLQDALEHVMALSLKLQRDDVTLSDSLCWVESTLELLEEKKGRKCQSLCQVLETGMYDGIRLKGATPKMVYTDDILQGLSDAISNRFMTDQKNVQNATKILHFGSWPAAGTSELQDYGDIEIPPAPETVASYDINGPRLMISKIVNENFKSYAGIRALGPFHKSFTSIIGPNGSGKSNVIDSMLFVFGYRAAKIRLKKLSGLIHNSENHLNIGSCTVTVYFQKIIDTGTGEDDYTLVPNSEFNVARTAFKDNSSVYSINGKRSTYKEVGTLLRASGIDLDHNRFLILQGEVEQIAMMKPKGQTEHDDGMLEFLEDIIGSNRFKEPIEILAKRVETLNELRGEKMNRVKAVEKEKDELEDAKNEAVEFLTIENNIVKLKNKLFQKYISTCMKNEEKSKAEYDKVNAGMEEFNTKMKEISDARQEKAKKQKKIYKANDDLKKKCEENKEKFSEFEKADVKLREDLKHAKAKGKKLEKSTEQEKKKIEELKEVPENAQKTIDDLNKKQERLEKEKQKEEVKLKEVMESLKTETQGLQGEKDKKEEKLLGLKVSVNETKSKLEVSQSELDLYLSNQKQETNKLNEKTNKLEKIKETIAEKTRSASEMESKLPDMENALEKSQTDLQNISKREAEIVEEVRGIRRKVEEARSALEANQSRGKVLEFVMNLKNAGTLPGVYGRLGDLGCIDEKFDVAISTACGALDYIVVDSMDTAQKCVDLLKKHNVGVATFIGLNIMSQWKDHVSRKIKTPENVHRLFDLVQVKNQEIKLAFYYALRDTLVADNLDQATRVAFGANRFRVVTLQGQLIDTSGTMSGGGKRVSKGRMGSSVVTDVDTKDLANNETKLKKLSDEGQQCRVNKERLEDFIKQQKKDITHVKHSLQKSEIEIKALREQVQILEVQIVEQKEKVKAAAPDEKQLKQLEKMVAEYRKDYQKVAGVADKLEAEVQELHNQIMDIGGSKMSAAQSRVNTIQTQIDQVVGQITKANVGIKTSERNLKKAEDKLASLYEEIEENKEDVKKLEAELGTLEVEATKVMEAYQESQDTMKAAETALSEVNKELAELEEEENKIQKEVVDVRAELDKFQTMMKESQAKLKHWKKELSHLVLTPIDRQEVEELQTITEEELGEINKEDIQFNITVQEEKLTQMKPNMAAIAEYRKKEELYLQRVADLDQITEFRDKQRKYHEDLRKQRLDEFMAGFGVITYKLKEMYQMITLGGDAELELVDSLDPFSEGIAFSVRPPKKSWKNISNLSGGEKTLSSLALVFALHHFKPTPLYVMDEIDAALDFKNVSIVAHYIKERTKNAQFIIISLRNNMFELADRLVGIYKTDNCTKSVTINPSKLAMPRQEEEA